MATNLEEAFEKAAVLPEERQQAIAELVLREVRTHYYAAEMQAKPPGVERRDANLYVKGTRITVYDLMDYLTSEDWSSDAIRDHFSFSQIQWDAILAFIDENREMVESEYQEVLRNAEENRRYWEERNRERIAWIHSQPPLPGKEAIYEKLRKLKLELGME
jgi:uncharacterized protein (DUF433 family)